MNRFNQRILQQQIYITGSSGSTLLSFLFKLSSLLFVFGYVGTVCFLSVSIPHYAYFTFFTQLTVHVDGGLLDLRHFKLCLWFPMHEK